jgi:hypothetical protein
MRRLAVYTLAASVLAVALTSSALAAADVPRQNERVGFLRAGDAGALKVVAGKPGAASSKRIHGNKVYTISAALGDATTGQWISPALATALATCSTTATITAPAGTTLLKRACMEYSPATGKAVLNWVVSPRYRGPAVISFAYSLDGRTVSERRQTFTIVD